MKKKNIYIDIRHLDYWWGIYNFKNLTNWEDVIIYEKWGKGFRKLAWTCISSKTYFRNGLEDLKEDDGESEFVKKIEEFLKNNNTIYHYFYDKYNDENFYEVPFEAERNVFNIKPRSIETWYPYEGIDKSVIDNVVSDFCKKFLNIEARSIIYKNELSIDKAQEEYIKAIVEWQQCKGIMITEDLIEEMEKELNLSRDRVLELVERFIKG